ncbi:hypothetical protein, partial [Shigella sonnei]|uniref:hypothetical protein n=1 Tax=Shigella sonnei TaxID=624 RepID=UPI001C0A7182
QMSGNIGANPSHSPLILRDIAHFRYALGPKCIKNSKVEGKSTGSVCFVVPENREVSVLHY